MTSGTRRTPSRNRTRVRSCDATTRQSQSDLQHQGLEQVGRCSESYERLQSGACECHRQSIKHKLSCHLKGRERSGRAAQVPERLGGSKQPQEHLALNSILSDVCKFFYDLSCNTPWRSRSPHWTTLTRSC